jgi:GTP pyrophosphokinase
MSRAPNITLSQLLEALPAGPDSESGRLVQRAYEFAVAAHGSLRRESRELYVEHDLAVAQTISSLHLDTSSIVASIVHDTLLPHTQKSADNLRQEFGPDVAGLVTSLVKLDQYTESQNKQRDERMLEQIRRSILSIIEGNTRIILIKMADFLQELRKAAELSPQRQKEIAGEARDIYAPLANRLGIWQLKWELDDLAFRFLEPVQYRSIVAKLEARRAERENHVAAAVRTLQERLAGESVRAEVSGRPKHIYSIYRKMKMKGVPFEDIYDVRALRVIVESKDRNACYQVLGIVHSLWQPIPQEFDDYIARPKPNGYQSLHTTVIDRHGQTLEVQIRTRDMHLEAERGIAAHWAYKEGARKSQTANRQIQGLRQLLASLQDAELSGSDSAAFRAEVLGERIYVFTPRGDVLDMPANATPIDFAYQIHSEVGHRCRGARVNDKMVSLDYRLRSGDKVEIITANRGGPSRDWMNENLGFTGSARTRSKIRSWFRQQERAKNIQQGLDVVTRELRRLGVLDTYTAEDIATALKFKDVEDFLARVGFGDVQSAQIGGAISLLQQKLKPDDELRPLLRNEPKPKGLTVLGVAGLHTKMANCCNPIPPEPIVGYITRGKGVTIHRQDCKQLRSIGELERLIEVDWGIQEETYPIPIVIKAYRRPGLMDDIANVLKSQKVNLSRTKTTTANSVATIYIQADVTSLDQLNYILGRFETLPNVVEVHRQRWND